MSALSITDLRTDIDAVLQRVTDNGETIQIVSHGQVIAQLVPVDPPLSTRPLPESEADGDADDDAVWAELMRLGREISKTWPKGVSAVDAIRDQRV